MTHLVTPIEAPKLQNFEAFSASFTAAANKRGFRPIPTNYSTLWAIFNQINNGSELYRQQLSLGLATNDGLCPMTPSLPVRKNLFQVAYSYIYQESSLKASISWTLKKDPIQNKAKLHAYVYITDSAVLEGGLEGGGYKNLYFCLRIINDSTCIRYVNLRGKTLMTPQEVKKIAQNNALVSGKKQLTAGIPLPAQADESYSLFMKEGIPLDRLISTRLHPQEEETPFNTPVSDENLPLKIALMKGIAKALETLQKRGMCHRDIKPENIVIQERKTLLIDGDSCCKVNNRPKFNELLGYTERYAAPEFLNEFLDGLDASNHGDSASPIITFEQDIYSLGCVFWEILTGKIPHLPEIDPMSLYTDIRGHLNAHHKNSPVITQKKKISEFTELTELAQSMCAYNPKDRPKIHEIINTIERLGASSLKRKHTPKIQGNTPAKRPKV